MRVIGIFFTCAVLLVSMQAGVFAHTLFMNVEDNGDGTVLVEGLYSTGAMAARTPVLVKDSEGVVLWKGKTDQSGQCEVPKPDVPYTIMLDAGPGHRVEQAGPPK